MYCLTINKYIILTENRKAEINNYKQNLEERKTYQKRIGIYRRLEDLRILRREQGLFREFRKTYIEVRWIDKAKDRGIANAMHRSCNYRSTERKLCRVKL